MKTSKKTLLLLSIFFMGCVPAATNANLSLKDFPINVEKGQQYYLSIQAPLSPVGFSSKVTLVIDPKTANEYYGPTVRSEGRIDDKKVRIYGDLKKNRFSFTVFLNPNVAIYSDRSTQGDSIDCDFTRESQGKTFIGEALLNSQYYLPKGSCLLSEIPPKNIDLNASLAQVVQDFSSEKLLDLMDVQKIPVRPGSTWQITALPPGQTTPLTFTTKITGRYTKKFNDNLQVIIAESAHDTGLGFVQFVAGIEEPKSTFETGSADFVFFLNPNARRDANLLGNTGKEKYLSCSVNFYKNQSNAQNGRSYIATGEQDDFAVSTGNLLPTGDCTAQRIN
jgi:hypothetical protein